MNSDQIDADLERRFREVLQEVMPQLEPIAGRHSLWDDDDPVADGDDDAAFVAAMPFSRRAETAFPRRPFSMLIAASLVAIAGVGAALALTVGHGEDVDVPKATVTPTTTVAVQATPIDGGSLLTTEVPAGTQPMMVLDRPDWALDGYAGAGPVHSAGPSATCAGCGVTRLIVAADGPLFSGPVFTAWILNDDYDITQFDAPVMIGATEGAFSGSDSSTPAAQNEVRVVWPIGPGRTAFVEAAGLSNEQVFAMAATLTFDTAVPILPNAPAGLSVVPTPSGVRLTTQIYDHFGSGTPYSDQYGAPGLELIVTDGGLQGLFDWRNPGRPLGWGVPRTINGTTVLLDRDPDPNEPPILTIEATWNVGTWNFLAIGHVFATEAGFLDAVAGLRITDAASFAAAVDPVSTYSLSTLTPNEDGSGGVFAPVE